MFVSRHLSINQWGIHVSYYVYWVTSRRRNCHPLWRSPHHVVPPDHNHQSISIWRVDSIHPHSNHQRVWLNKWMYIHRRVVIRCVVRNQIIVDECTRPHRNRREGRIQYYPSRLVPPHGRINRWVILAWGYDDMNFASVPHFHRDGISGHYYRNV